MKVKSILAILIMLCLITSISLNLVSFEFNKDVGVLNSQERGNTAYGDLITPEKYWSPATYYDRSSDCEWSQVYGTTNYDSFEDIVQCDDGGFAIVGTYNGAFGQFGEIWLLRTDSSGNHVWNETYTTGSNQNRGVAIVKCQDGSFAIAGNANPDRILIRVTDNGTELWRNTYSDVIGDSVKDLVYCEDGGFAILSYNGTSSWPPNMDYRLLRTDENGTVLWERGYSKLGYEESYGLTCLDDGGFAIVGHTQDIEGGGDEDIWVVRTDSDGVAVWDQTYGGSDYESGSAILECENGDLIFTGKSTSYGDATLWVVRTTSTGVVLWNKTYGGWGDSGNSIYNTTDGGFIIGGFKSENMDVLVIRINSTGGLLWTYDWGNGNFEECNSIIQCYEGDFLYVGKTTTYGAGGYSQFVQRISDFPFWDELPLDQAISHDELYYHDYNASLPHGLDHWWIDISPQFVVNSSTGVVTTLLPLPEGYFPLEIGVIDLRGNWIRAIIEIAVYGETPPIWVDEPIYISRESDFESYGFPGDGTSENPYRIEDKVFWLNVTEFYSRMIAITNTRSHFIIENCTFQGRNELQEIGEPTEYMWFGGMGIELWNVSNGVIRDCTFNIVDHGVFLITSSDIVVEDCEIHNPLFGFTQPQGIGVQIDDASTRNRVINNRITSVGEGVSIFNSTYNVIDQNTIRESIAGVTTSHFARMNTFSNNTLVYNLYEGISFSRSNDTLVIMNNCSYNGYSGIVLDEESKNVTLIFNTLEGNGGLTEPEDLYSLAQSPIMGYGVYVEWGSENNITWNDFVDNSRNARNDRSGNSFDYNYYSDYTGEDEDGDLIGDTAYEITGDSHTDDLHPRLVRLYEMRGPSTSTTPTTPTGGGLFDDNLILMGVLAAGSMVLIVVVILIVRRRN